MLIRSDTAVHIMIAGSVQATARNTIFNRNQPCEATSRELNRLNLHALLRARVLNLIQNIVLRKRRLACLWTNAYGTSWVNIWPRLPSPY